MIPTCKHPDSVQTRCDRTYSTGASATLPGSAPTAWGQPLEKIPRYRKTTCVYVAMNNAKNSQLSIASTTVSHWKNGIPGSHRI